MDLPSIFKFKGWSIRYKLCTPNNPSTQQPVKLAVFVHGTPWSSVVFRPIIEALLAKGSHGILVYDLPGYGQSQDLEGDSGPGNSTADFHGDTSVRFQAEALTALLEHTQLDGRNGHPSPAIIAHDIAGAIVLRTHLLHKCDFESMMLLDTNTVLPWGDGFYKLVRSEPKAFLQLPPNIYEAVVRAVIKSACHNPKVLQSGWEDELAQPWIDDNGADAAKRQRSFVRQIAQANDADVAEMLDADMYKRMRCDVKVVWGEQDQWIPKEKIEQLIEKMDGRVKEVAFVPDAGHLVMLDQPERLAIEVFDWLKRTG